MTSIFLYGEVDLPPIPSELLCNIDTFPPEKYVVDTGFGKIFERNNVVKKNCSYTKRIVTHALLANWVKNTVPPWPESEPLTIQKVIPAGLAGDSIFPIHHDLKRMFALNYILTTGGESVTTNWFRDINQPVVRSLEKKICMQSDTGPVEYADVEFLSSIQCVSGKWYLIRTNVLHDVDHIEYERSAVTIPYFNEDIVVEFKQKNLFKTIHEISDV